MSRLNLMYVCHWNEVQVHTTYVSAAPVTMCLVPKPGPDCGICHTDTLPGGHVSY